MRRSLLYVLIGFVSALAIGFYLKSNKSPMSADDFTRTSTQMPDMHNVKEGWVHNQQADQVSPDNFGGQFREEIYDNQGQDMMVYLYVHQDKNGTERELFANYGGKNVGRAAIKIEDKWHIAKEPFYDNGVDKPDYRIKQSVIVDGSANVVGMKLSLETIDGPKELLLYLVNPAL